MGVLYSVPHIRSYDGSLLDVLDSPPAHSSVSELKQRQLNANAAWYTQALEEPLIDPRTGTRVHLLGTNHGIQELALDVFQLVRAVRPHVVAVEQRPDSSPDGARLAYGVLEHLPYDEGGRFRRAVLGNVWHYLSYGVPARVIFDMMKKGSRPHGWEMWSAVAAADRLTPPATVFYIDVPQAKYAKLHRDFKKDYAAFMTSEKAKGNSSYFVHLLQRYSEISDLKLGDYLRQPFPRLFPSLYLPNLENCLSYCPPQVNATVCEIDRELGAPHYRHLVVPRDQHMFQRLWDISQDLRRNPTDENRPNRGREEVGKAMSNINPRMVAVVGRGHVAGIRKLWETATENYYKAGPGSTHPSSINP